MTISEHTKPKREPDRMPEREQRELGASSRAGPGGSRALWSRGYGLRAVNTIDRATARWRSDVKSIRMRSISCGVKSG